MKLGKATAIETVCGFLNMCPPMNVSAYHKTGAELYEHYKITAINDMKQVTHDICKMTLKEKYTNDAIVDIDASFDGT